MRSSGTFGGRNKNRDDEDGEDEDEEKGVLNDELALKTLSLNIDDKNK